MQISQDFKNALTLCGTPQYKLALEIGCHPVTLNRLITGYQPLKREDERLKKVARLIKFPENRIFEQDSSRDLRIPSLNWSCKTSKSRRSTRTKYKISY